MLRSRLSEWSGHVGRRDHGLASVYRGSALRNPRRILSVSQPRSPQVCGRSSWGASVQTCQRRQYAVAAEQSSGGVVRRRNAISRVMGTIDAKYRIPTIHSCKATRPTISMRCMCSGRRIPQACMCHGRYTSGTWRRAICPSLKPFNLLHPLYPLQRAVYRVS